MKRFCLNAVFRITELALVAGACLPRVALAQDLIHRRDQARSAFLSSPQGIYRHFCAHCHGEEGKGDGRFWASELSPPPADLTVQSDKQYVIAVIRGGSVAHGRSNLCPPWDRTISSANVERLAQYVVSLGGKTSLPPSGPVAPHLEPFPWLLVAVLVSQVLALWRMLRRKKAVSNVVP